MNEGTNPRKAHGGGIAGPGGPHDKNAVIVDAKNAVMLAGVTVTMVEPSTAGVRGRPLYALNLEGRINKTKEQVNINFLFEVDGAAAIITELIALSSRMGPGPHDDLMQSIEERMTKIAAEGHL